MSAETIAQCDGIPYPFIHGVASGDATQHEVILWTRITQPDLTGTESVRWYISEDAGFSEPLYTGVVATDETKDYTVKTDVGFLQPDTWYYYCFEWNGIRSEAGRTHTLPMVAGRFSFAAFSCANYELGYFNALNNAASRNDLHAVFFLGDYYYEISYGSGPAERTYDPPYEAYLLDDYRRRHAQHAQDPDVQWLRRQYPWYVIWDDHEFANDAWYGGAPGHDDSQLSWQQRKEAARRAYFEWMPIRESESGNIHRTFEIENLIRLVFVDSRMEGRMQQVDASSEETNDPTRTILGSGQLDWLKDELLTADADQWKVMLNSVMVNRAIDASGYPLDNDVWEGYRPERDSLLRFIRNHQIENFISVAGDYHSSWAGNLPLNDYDEMLQTGSAGVELSVCATSSSPHTVGDIPAFMKINPHIEWIEQTSNGYLLCSATQENFYSKWIYVSTVLSTDYSVTEGQVVRVEKSNPFLILENESFELPLNDALHLSQHTAPLTLSGWMDDVKYYPVPADDQLTIEFFSTCGTAQIKFYDLLGRLIAEYNPTFDHSGKKRLTFDLNSLPSGSYLLQMIQGGDEHVKHVILR
jgi:alkaline phosphatase D